MENNESKYIKFTDVNFKNALLKNKHLNPFNEVEIFISVANAYEFVIDVEGENIKSLDGIEHFPLITELDCSYNNLTTLDVSNNKLLHDLYCHNNELSKLDTSNNKALTELWCGYNLLSSLNVGNNKDLAILWCAGNNFSEKDKKQLEASLPKYCYIDWQD